MINRLKEWISNQLLRIIPVRWQYLRWQLVSGQPHEADINLFRHLNGISGLVLDLGANYGQFALSVFCVNQRLTIESWEPNPQLRWALRFIKCLHPWRFRYRLYGAGDQPGEITLHIPVTSKDTRATDLTTNASLDPQEFEKDYVQQRLHDYSDQQDYHLQAIPVSITTVDLQQPSPLVIKIDVEGWELQALQGMQTTLERYHPMLMIEVNNHKRWYPWLRKMGYHTFIYQQQQPALLLVEGYTPELNVFCLHPQSPPQLLQQLQPLLPKKMPDDW